MRGGGVETKLTPPTALEGRDVELELTFQLYATRGREVIFKMEK